MRKSIIALLIFAFAFSPAFAYDDNCDGHWSKSHLVHDGFLEDVDIDIDDGTIIMTHNRRPKGKVEITEDYELYVNGRLVATNDEQKELLEDYYDLTMEVVEYATQIGYEGAKIGVSGAAIGLMAIGGVFKAFMTDYEFEELEDDLEEEAEELEARAEELEEKAEDLEGVAEELADVHDDLRRETPELRDLDWF
jgi:hypothetical protein